MWLQPQVWGYYIVSVISSFPQFLKILLIREPIPWRNKSCWNFCIKLPSIYSARMNLAVFQSFANFGLCCELWLSLLIILTPRRLITHLQNEDLSETLTELFQMPHCKLTIEDPICGVLSPNCSWQPTLSQRWVFIDVSIIIVSIIFTFL